MGAGRGRPFIAFPRAAARASPRTRDSFLISPEICMALHRRAGERVALALAVAQPLSSVPAGAEVGRKPRSTVFRAAATALPRWRRWCLISWDICMARPKVGEGEAAEAKVVGPSLSSAPTEAGAGWKPRFTASRAATERVRQPA